MASVWRVHRRLKLSVTIMVTDQHWLSMRKQLLLSNFTKQLNFPLFSISQTPARYHPTIPGEYAIHILCDNEDISKSPFIAQIQPKSNARPEMIACYGTGIQPHGQILGCSTEFKINTKKSGKAPLEVHVIVDTDAKLNLTETTIDNETTSFG